VQDCPNQATYFMNTDRYKCVSYLHGNASKRERMSIRKRNFSCSGGRRLNSGVVLHPTTSSSFSGKLEDTIPRLKNSRRQPSLSHDVTEQACSSRDVLV
jgi:hypothetical protein